MTTARWQLRATGGFFVMTVCSHTTRDYCCQSQHRVRTNTLIAGMGATLRATGKAAWQSAGRAILAWKGIIMCTGTNHHLPPTKLQPRCLS